MKDRLISVAVRRKLVGYPCPASWACTVGFLHVSGGMVWKSYWLKLSKAWLPPNPICVIPRDCNKDLYRIVPIYEHHNLNRPLFVTSLNSHHFVVITLSINNCTGCLCQFIKLILICIWWNELWSRVTLLILRSWTELKEGRGPRIRDALFGIIPYKEGREKEVVGQSHPPHAAEVTGISLAQCLLLLACGWLWGSWACVSCPKCPVPKSTPSFGSQKLISWKKLLVLKCHLTA